MAPSLLPPADEPARVELRPRLPAPTSSIIAVHLTEIRGQSFLVHLTAKLLLQPRREVAGIPACPLRVLAVAGGKCCVMGRASFTKQRREPLDGVVNHGSPGHTTPSPKSSRWSGATFRPAAAMPQ